MDAMASIVKCATGEFIKFIVVGFSNFLVSYATFLVLISLMFKTSWSAGLAQAISYSAGIVWSFYWNGRWTFRVNSLQRSTFVRFLLWQLTLLALSSILIAVWVNQSSLAAGIIWILVMGPVTLLNFTGTRWFVFRRPSK